MGDNYGALVQKGMFNSSSWFIEKTEKVIKMVLEQIDMIEKSNLQNKSSKDLKKKCEGELMDLCSIYCFLNHVEPDSELNKELIVNQGNMLEKLKVHYGLSEKKGNVHNKKDFMKFSREMRRLLKSASENRIQNITELISKNKERFSFYKDQIKSIEECIDNMRNNYITWDIGKVIIGCILDSSKNI